MAYFPMYVDITNEYCLIIGGGKVALRKIEVLLDFQAKVKVIADNVCEGVRKFAEKGLIELEERVFTEGDLDQCRLVIAATSDHELNHNISELAKKRGIPVNAVDQIEDCTFIFPAYIKEKNLVAAFSSSGKSPVTVQYLKTREKEILTPFLGEVNEYLGKIRQQVIDTYPTEQERRNAFRAILEQALNSEEIPE